MKEWWIMKRWWIDRRVKELIAVGKLPDAAVSQAQGEWRLRKQYRR